MERAGSARRARYRWRFRAVVRAPTGSDARCRTTTRSSSAPATTGWSARRTSPGPGCARCWSRRARPSAARRPASRSPAPRSTSATATTSRSARRRSSRSSASPITGCATSTSSRRRSTWRGSGGPAWPHVPRRRAHARRARHARYPDEVDGYRRYLAGRDAGRAARVRRRERSADRSRGLRGKVLARRVARRSARCCAGAGASAADVMRAVLPLRRAAGARRCVDGADGVGHLAGDAGLRSRCAHVRDAPRRPRSGGRSAAAGRCPRRSLAAFVAAGGTLRTACTGGDRSPARATACAASRWPTAPSITAAVVVSACNPHDTFLRWLTDPPPQAASLVERWRAIAARRRGTSRRSTRS